MTQRKAPAPEPANAGHVLLLTDDELDQIEGNREKLAGRIQERYGIAKDEAERQIDDWASRTGR